jgi:hypothetical protein
MVEHTYNTSDYAKWRSPIRKENKELVREEKIKLSRLKTQRTAERVKGNFRQLPSLDQQLNQTRNRLNTMAPRPFSTKRWYEKNGEYPPRPTRAKEVTVFKRKA